MYLMRSQRIVMLGMGCPRRWAGTRKGQRRWMKSRKGRVRAADLGIASLSAIGDVATALSATLSAMGKSVAEVARQSMKAARGEARKFGFNE